MCKPPHRFSAHFTLLVPSEQYVRKHPLKYIEIFHLIHLSMYFTNEDMV